jgi:transposase
LQVEAPPLGRPAGIGGLIDLAPEKRLPRLTVYYQLWRAWHVENGVRARYTLEYKQEAVRLVRGGQPIGAVARGLGISDQTVHNWVKAEAEGRLAETTIKPFTAEQAEIARLKAELARVRMERDILKNHLALFAPVGVETVSA